MQIFLIRHPQPALESSVCYGHTDIPLHSQAVLNLPSTALALREQLPDNIPLFSSPLLRCRLLAEALHHPVVYDDRLKEMHFGEWEMRPWSDIPRPQLDHWAADPLHYVIPGGESVAQMQERVLEFIHKRSEAELALVTHAGVMKILFALAKARPANEWMNLHFDYGSLHIIDFNLRENL